MSFHVIVILGLVPRIHMDTRDKREYDAMVKPV